MPELEVTGENWCELYASGFRHFLNVVPERLSELEFLDLVAFAKQVAGGEGDFAFGAVYDDLCGPVECSNGLGLYVRRPAGWGRRSDVYGEDVDLGEGATRYEWPDHGCSTASPSRRAGRRSPPRGG